MLSRKVSFGMAVPVWAYGREKEMNLSLLFQAQIPYMASPVLRVTASCSYMLFINGEFTATGPARCAHGFFRVDEIPLKLQPEGPNQIQILVAGYNVNSYMHLDQTSFLCAEVEDPDSGIVCWTDSSEKSAGGFTAREHTERVQKVQRFSIQRTFVELYDYHRKALTKPVALSEVSAGIFLERGIPYPDFSVSKFNDVIATGDIRMTDREPRYMRAIDVIGPSWKGYPVSELEACTIWDVEKMDFMPQETMYRKDFTPCTLQKNTYAVFDLEKEHTGMIGLHVSCKEPLVLYALFDEILTDEDPHKVICNRSAVSGLVVWRLPAGDYRLLSYEPYSMRYLKLCAIGGDCLIEDLYVRNYQFREIPAERLARLEDPVLQKIYDAAVETFRQNTVDIYMDCPSRERAGWLCDSYFTAQVERLLTGESVIERNFLEHFIIPGQVRCIPEGMLPMCYPSDFYDGSFIPNWAMFYVLQLQMYQKRTGDSEMVERARPVLYRLLDYFRPFENEFGLLEGLKGSVFVEWSKANEFLWDVNFPTNFLYAAMKRAMGELYADPGLLKEAEDLLHVASQMSFNGEFFRDSAMREPFGLVPKEECTEACQYYAFFFHAGTPETHPELFSRLLTDFGPARKTTGLWPRVYPANAFIGNYLRLSLLKRYGYEEKLREEIKGYFAFMADRTGTLWEHDRPSASCNHGFASYVICLLTGEERI